MLKRPAQVTTDELATSEGRAIKKVTQDIDDLFRSVEVAQGMAEGSLFTLKGMISERVVPVFTFLFGRANTRKTTVAEALANVATRGDNSRCLRVSANETWKKQLFEFASTKGTTNLKNILDVLIMQEVKLSFDMSAEQCHAIHDEKPVVVTIRGRIPKYLRLLPGAIYKPNNRKPSQSTLTASFIFPRVFIMFGNDKLRIDTSQSSCAFIEDLTLEFPNGM